MRSKNLAVFTSELKVRYPGIIIFGIGNDAHKLHTSDHNEDDTVGSRAAQSDADSIPEHRAIDVMLGSAFSRSQANSLIQEILANPRLLKRLWYINFENYQWSRSNGWVRGNNSDDPHPDHIHFSALAADDDNTSPWLTTGVNMYAKLGEKSEMVRYLQHRLLTVDPGCLPQYGADADFGGEVQRAVSRILTGGEPQEVNGEWFAKLDDMCADKRAENKVRAMFAELLAQIPTASPEALRAAVESALTSLLPDLRISR